MHEPNDECWYVDRGTCAYYRGEGTCSFGCSTEPSCMTDRPREGWPCERDAHSRAVATGSSLPAWVGPIGPECAP